MILSLSLSLLAFVYIERFVGQSSSPKKTRTRLIRIDSFGPTFRVFVFATNPNRCRAIHRVDGGAVLLIALLPGCPTPFFTQTDHLVLPTALFFSLCGGQFWNGARCGRSVQLLAPSSSVNSFSLKETPAGRLLHSKHSLSLSHYTFDCSSESPSYHLLFANCH